MDNPATGPPEAHFGPDLRYTAAATLGILAALAVLAFSADAPGRLLSLLAILLLATYVGGDLVFRPRVSVSRAGIVVRSPLIRARLAWADVERVHAPDRLRLGIRATTLEIDAGSVLAVFSRRALGADPNQVADLVNAFRPT